MDLDRQAFQRCGAQLVLQAASPEDLQTLTALTDSSALNGPGRRLSAPPAGLVRELVKPGGLADIASHLEGEPLRPVRLLVFDKSAQSNWAVGWHQDRVLPLETKCILPGFDRWTTKAEIPHVEPPEWLSRRMVTIRLHLDDCGPENAPLKVIDGSHALGRLSDDRVKTARAAGKQTVFCARSGDALAVKTLILHASDRAKAPGRRRVLHVDFAPDALPEGLSWTFNLPGQ